MSCYPERGSHIRDKLKVVLDLSNYATKKEVEHAAGVETSDVAPKKDVIALKAEDDKLDINKLVSVLTSLNNLKTKVDYIDVGELITVLIDLKKLSDVVDKKAFKNTKSNTLNDTHSEKLCFTQFSIRVASWLFLTFYVYTIR